METELEKSLLEVGFRLASPPSDVAALLDLLDQTEIFLSRAGQAPSESMLAVVHPTRTTLVAPGLLRHSDINVRVAVVSCISGILRIMAPDPPYEDGQMKVIFEMMVEAFQKLDDESSQSYLNRVSILEIAAKVKCCIMMLDLDCDALIIEMFCCFLKTIRPNHPAFVFTSMESIMTLLLEESDDIPPNLLSCLLESVKKCNKGVQTVAQRLGEKVISNCSAKLKPYLVRVLSPFVPNKYTDIIASICQENAGALEQNETNNSGDALISETPKDESILDQSLVGSKIKFWWPGDKRYYDGQVSSFDFESGKHTILYDDGDREVLLPREERFKLLGSDNEMEEEDQEDDILLPLASLVSRKKKKAIANSGSDRVTSESLKSGQDSDDKHDTIPKKSRRPKGESSLARPKSLLKDRSRTSKMDKKTMIVYSKTASKSKSEPSDTDTNNHDAHNAKSSEATCKSMTECTDMSTNNSDAHKAKPSDGNSKVRQKPITPKLSALERVKNRFYEPPSEAEESGIPTELQKGQRTLAQSKRKRNPNPKYF